MKYRTPTWFPFGNLTPQSSLLILNYSRITSQDYIPGSYQNHTVVNIQSISQSLMIPNSKDMPGILFVKIKVATWRAKSICILILLGYIVVGNRHHWAESVKEDASVWLFMMWCHCLRSLVPVVHLLPSCPWSPQGRLTAPSASSLAYRNQDLCSCFLEDSPLSLLFLSNDGAYQDGEPQDYHNLERYLPPGGISTTEKDFYHLVKSFRVTRHMMQNKVFTINII